jgi:oligopeptide/dipeptide ABC transporter ATP-binding protein
MKTVLEVKNLKTWIDTDAGTAKAVDDISFSLMQGKTTALVGESGCGKSMTALSIMGLLPDIAYHPSGEVIFNSENILTYSYSKFKQLRGNSISMIFQEPGTALNPVFTIGTQITECIKSHENVTKYEALEKAEHILHEVGIPDPSLRLTEYPHQLSGGMKQRIMIAMALITKPTILIADEPTTALDVTIQAQILDLMNKLKDEYQTAILLITHDLGIVAENADMVSVMYSGKIAEQGSVRDILTHPKHPYTRALLGSLPANNLNNERLYTIPGTVLHPTIETKGCRYAGRCTNEIPECTEKEPVFRQMQNIFISCHNPGET